MLNTGRLSRELGAIFQLDRLGRLRPLSLPRFVKLVLEWCERSEQRRRLAQLDERMLRDIGISRTDAYRESHKWFWQD